MNPKVDEYLNKATKWQEELKLMRTILLDCGLVEDFKWRNPCYTFHNSNIVILGGFKEYCAINFFKGQIRNVGINETIDDSTINLTVASHWANWNLTKGRHFSDESQQSFSSGDKGMEFATQTKDDVRWGK